MSTKYNFKIVNSIANFLNSNFENSITMDIENVMETGVDSELALRLFIGESGGYDTFGKDREEFLRYFPLAIKKLNVNEYFSNEYYKKVKFTDEKMGNIELCYEKYRKYEPFVYDDLSLHFDGTVIPKVGFFEQDFIFPSVKEDGRIWMTVTPNEINTMKEPVSLANGKVLTLGLGLGYFAFSCAEKPEVEKVTVIEKNKDVIQLFNKKILPFFSYPEKIEIIESDGFKFMENPTKTDFDFIFCDLWHDVSDGLPMIERLKEYEKNFPSATFRYWIENSIKFYR